MKKIKNKSDVMQLKIYEKAEYLEDRFIHK